MGNKLKCKYKKKPKFKFNLQLFGGKGSSQTTVQSYQPTAQEIRLQKQAADYSEAVAPNALWLNNVAKGLLENSLGAVQVDYGALNNSAQNQIGAAQSGVQGLLQGKMPEEYQKNMEASIKSGVENSMGGLLGDLGSRGVINSSVMNKGVQGINDSAASAMSNAYTQNMGLLSQLYGQQMSGATAGIGASAAAQEAAQNPAMNLWNSSLGLNSGGTLGALNAVAGQGTTTATTNMSGGSGLFGGILTGLAGNTGLFGSNCFTEETKIKMADGSEKEIRHVKVGDEVTTIDIISGKEHNGVVLEVMQPHYAQVYTVVAKRGNVTKHVNTTLTQPLLSGNGIFIDVADMKIGQELADVGMVTAIVHSGERKVYDLKVSGDNTYFANGFIANGGTDEW